jgi:hypothetical protein
MDKDKAHDCLVALWRKYKACQLDREMTRAMALDIIQDSGMTALELAAIVRETKGSCPIIDEMGIDA